MSHRTDRQSFLGPSSDEIIRGITLGVIGLGGAGSHVVQQAVHIGFFNFVLVDPDTIDETNLNRLVGATSQDVVQQRCKVDIAERTVRAVQPGAVISKHATKWQDAIDGLKRCDVVLGAVDSVIAKDELDAFCRRYHIPYIDIGMDVHELGSGHFLISGQVVLSMSGGPCLRCYGVVTEAVLAEEGRKYGAAGGRPQVVWPNGVLASTTIGLLMQLITPWHPATRRAAYLEYDGNTGTVSVSKRLATLENRECAHRPLLEAGDPSFDIRRPPQITAPETKSPLRRRIVDVLVGQLMKKHI